MIQRTPPRTVSPAAPTVPKVPAKKDYSWRLNRPLHRDVNQDGAGQEVAQEVVKQVSLNGDASLNDKASSNVGGVDVVNTADLNRPAIPTSPAIPASPTGLLPDEGEKDGGWVPATEAGWVSATEAGGIPPPQKPPSPNTRSPRPVFSARRIADQYRVVTRPPGGVRDLAPRRPVVAVCVQYDDDAVGAGGIYAGGIYAGGTGGGANRGRGNPLSLSGAISFGRCAPGALPAGDGQGDDATVTDFATTVAVTDFAATVAVLMPTDCAPPTPKLQIILALLLNAAGCPPERLRECGVDVYVYAPHPCGVPAAQCLGLDPCLGLDLAPGALPRKIKLSISNLAKARFTIPAAVHDLTPLGPRGLRAMQRETQPAMQTPTAAQPAGPGRIKGVPHDMYQAGDVGQVADVGQDMAALYRAHSASYREVAAHQARLTLFYAVEIQGR